MNRRKTAQRKTGERIQTFLIGFFLGCIFSFSLTSWFLYLNGGPGPVIKEESVSEENSIPAEQEYEFWDMFPNNEVEVEKFNVQDRKYKHPEEIWEIQTGSFYEYYDANQVRGSLILLGLEARIERVSIEDKNRYRVILGPYNKKAEVVEIERLLEENDLESITKSIILEKSKNEPKIP